MISPELLVEDGLLEAEDLQQYCLPQEGKTNFPEVERIKSAIFEKVWTNYNRSKEGEFNKAFKKFTEKDSYWLDDFAVYMLLKQKNKNQPWFRWSDEFKLRDEKALKKLIAENESEIEKIKLLQFIFSKQWHELRLYCNNKGIKFFGDLPFYVSYNYFVIVWSHRELFSLDKEGNMIGVAGVPPDAFSDDGQLWVCRFFFGT